MSGEWAPEDLKEFLVQIAGLLGEKAREVRELLEESGYQNESPEEVEQGLGGIEHYERGMQEMWRFFEDGDAGHLQQGLELIWEGNERINKAMIINRESREDLDVTFFM